jgi:glucose/arabinose dehydrogenase
MIFKPMLALCLVMLAGPALARPADSPPVPELPGLVGSAFKRPQVIGWPDGTKPDAPDGFQVELFASGLDAGRWLYVLPNGDVLVAQARTESMGGLPPEVVEQLVQQGMFGPSANNIILLRQTPNGVQRSVFVDRLNQPFGMLLHDGYLYVANTDSLVRFPYRNGMDKIDSAPEKLLDIPAGEETNPWNNHWTRNLIASPDGRKIYLSVGSATDANAEGVEHPERAAIWELNPDGSGKRLFATGLRNPVGMAFDPWSQDLWATVNERDGLGADVPPDYLTRVVAGAFYGWPWVYYGTYPDPTQSIRAPEKVAAAQETARVPDLALGGHSVPLGLLFYRGDKFPARYRQGAFVARRAGVGRAQFNGPDVLFLPFENGAPTGEIEPFLTGFVADGARGTVHGRAVGLAELPDGSLLVADDGANVIWRISRAD